MDDTYLITSSLLDAWKTLLETEYSSLEEFVSILKREKREQTEAQKQGDIFEEWAVKNYKPTLQGQYQVKLYKNIKSKSGQEYLLYGRLDCLKMGKVYDYKHTSSYEAGKFFNRCQTSVYLDLVPEADEMIYVISTNKPKYLISMEEQEGQKDISPYTIYTESYKREEVKDIREIIYDFECWLKNMDLWEIYTENWKSH